MKKNDPAYDFLFQPSRQSPVALLLILTQLIRRVIRQLWPILLILLFNRQGNFFTRLGIFAAILTGFSAITSIITYFRYYFYLTERELIIEKGVFRRVRVTVPLDRIQTVTFQQGPIQQFFNVVGVEIDTAGSKGSEFSIRALQVDQAQAFRQYLIDQDILSDAAEGNAATVSDKGMTEELLVHLSIADLFKVGVSQNHIRTAGIILALGFSVLDDLEQALGQSFFEYVPGWLGIDSPSSFFAILTAVIGLLIIAFFGTLILTAIRYFNLRFTKTHKGFKMVSGLITRKEQAATLNKIQYLRWSTSPLKRAFGLFTLRLLQIHSGGANEQRTLRIPGCKQLALQAVRAAYFPEEEKMTWTSHSISPLYQRRRMLYFGILPVLLLLGLSALDGQLEWQQAGLITWLPIAYFWNRQAFRNWKIEISPAGIRTGSGVLIRQFELLQWYKIQGVEISQSIYQRRKKVADLLLLTAAGRIRLPYLPLPLAHSLRNFILFSVESSDREWL
jgi:putative membrane protein